MKTIGAQDWQKLYASLKKEYDQLLEKNQNDLIKIRIREKQLNDKLAAILQEKEELERKLRAEIDALKAELSQCSQQTQTKQSSSIIQQQLRSLRLKLAQKQKEVALINRKRETEHKRTVSLEKQLQVAKLSLEKQQQAQQTRKAEEKRKTSQFEENIVKLRSQLQEFEVKMTQEKSQKETLHLQLIELERQLSRVKQVLHEREAELLQASTCSKCEEMSQQVDLHKQMLKSTKLMLKFKQMELDSLNHKQ